MLDAGFHRYDEIGTGANTSEFPEIVHGRDGDIPIANLIFKARKLAAILAVPRWRRAWLRYRVAAGMEHAAVLRNLGMISTVVDVGANRGQFALVVRHCFPDARIISFEPLRGPAETFTRVFANDPRIRLQVAALGACSGEAIIHVSARDDSSSLLPITEAQNALFPGTAETATQTIRVGRLAEFVESENIASPALLKLDVQGYELEALKGCEALLSRFAWVYCECSFIELYTGQALADEVIAWLWERSFKLCGVYNMIYDRTGRAVQADFLFARQSH